MSVLGHDYTLLGQKPGEPACMENSPLQLEFVLLFTKQCFDVPRAVIDMKHSNPLWNGVVKNQVIIKSGHAQ